MLGFNFEGIAASLAGHSVTGGDIHRWTSAGRARVRAYAGKAGLELTGAQLEHLQASRMRLIGAGLPLERLERISHARWDARKLPLRDNFFDGAVFDPPFNRYHKARNPIKLAQLVLNETARCVKVGAPVVIRVPGRWRRSLESAAPVLEHIGSYPVGKGLVMMKFAKRPD